jgi:hypothetical protein
MKKPLTIAALLLTSLSISAQTANLNITLSDVLSMTVSQPASLTVDFDSETKYTNGVNALAVDHISVVSNRGYLVKVISGVPTGPSSIAASTIKITAAIGTSNNGNSSGITYATSLTLPISGGTPAAVITSTGSSWSGSNSTSKFNVQYLIGSNGSYADKLIGANVVPVIYTISQP